ncbi:hypothetical protein GLYMA_19G113300v4 [Glycine max]|uniref:Exostosin GT47 domain-containing protein n=1 Tax=Glycine max TaxID=3847 RepID=A0A0R0EKL1_SOYBN|nr:hypothetical protein GYH30_052730 [Glycine max]KRG94847.1 hypothetical protein GLYMA_19G113300v4 [Glycine max]
MSRCVCVRLFQGLLLHSHNLSSLHLFLHSLLHLLHFKHLHPSQPPPFHFTFQTTPSLFHYPFYCYHSSLRPCLQPQCFRVHKISSDFPIGVWPRTAKSTGSASATAIQLKGEDDPFANVLLPVESEPGGNYTSESYFKKVLMKSHFITKDPPEADLFFLPFSMARLWHDRRVGVGGIQDFIRDYIHNISHRYPYWNNTGGADHFYVACHSIGRSAMDKAPDEKFNAIQVVCSSSYFLTGYFAHKDACLPQIWPRKGNPPNLVSSKRKRLAFFAGGVNSPVRVKLLETWKNDSEIFVHHGRLKTPYADELLGSKFCLHVKGFEVNTARIGDSLYYGCVPVIIANYYDLPFADVLNWKSFSVVVTTLDIPLLKKILKDIISSNKYLMLQSNVLKVRKHFQWHSPPQDFDAFYMVMYELWLRRSSIKNTWVDSFRV